MEEHALDPAAGPQPAASPQARPRLVLVSNRPGAADTRSARPVGPSAAEQLLNVELPPRPGVLVELGAEMQNPEPDFDRVSALVTADVGLGAAVIKTANSPYIGLGRRVTSVQQAIYYLGLAEVFVIVSGLLLRRAFPSADPNMERVWDASARRAALMGRLGCEHRGLPRDRVHTCGLFENCGMAVLLIYAPGYSRGLAQIEAAANPQELERTQYGLDHTVIGEALVRTWGLSEEVALAVRYHHDMHRLDALDLPAESRTLIALSAAVGETLARGSGRTREEWAAESCAVAAVLGWTPQDLEARIVELLQHPEARS
jgi:HD-like signal output (HDOD) protein